MVKLTRVCAKENSVVRYQNKIPALHVMPHARAISDELIVIDDNARPHRPDFSMNTLRINVLRKWNGQFL